MTEDFVPAPSVDSRTIPMEVQIPLLQPSSYPEYSSDNNGLKPSTKSDQHVVHYPPNDLKIPETPVQIFSFSLIKTLTFYQALISEFIGTMLLVLICTSSGLPIASKSVPDLQGALSWGFVVATIIVGFGHISGAHLNPAVTVTLLASLEIELIRALGYIVMQVLGAVTASFLLSLLAPVHAHGNLGMTMISEGISIPQALIVEFIITFVLCYTVHAICDKRRDDIGGSKALAVGLAVTVGCLFGGPYTGASMNPARSFGPAAAMNSWGNHWVYWVGPMAGSIAAALVYKLILKQQVPIVTHNKSR